MPEDNPQVATVTLRVYDWHCLLREMEFGMSIRDCPGHSSRDLTVIYDVIGVQLGGVPVKKAPLQEALTAPPADPFPAVKDEPVSWFSRFWSGKW